MAKISDLLKENRGTKESAELMTALGKHFKEAIDKQHAIDAKLRAATFKANTDWMVPQPEISCSQINLVVAEHVEIKSSSALEDHHPPKTQRWTATVKWTISIVTFAITIITFSLDYLYNIWS